MNRKYHLATYGCQMNVYDSNLIAGMLERRGMEQTEILEQADVIIVNTCSIRGGAEDRAYARIAGMRHFKRLNPQMRIAVIGCMAQNHGEKIPVSLEHVDYVVGPDNYKELEQRLFEQEQETQSVGSPALSPEPVVLTNQDAFENYPGLDAKIQSSVSTHITIMRGCNKQCTYCIVPSVRGKERSRPRDEILREARYAVSQGIREICLLGQTVNSYRSEGEDFASLLRSLQDVDGLLRIRFTSPHPRHFTSSVIEAMAQCPKVCRHVHLPLQSGSNRILKKMRRQYTRERYLEIVESLRQAMPRIGITTDIITGFVGETHADFLQTLDLMREVGFDHAFMFSYSPREGTPAYEETETLDPKEKAERLQQVIDLQLAQTERSLNAMVGQEAEVLIEDFSARNNREWIGKTSCFKKVIVPFAQGLEKGNLARVRIIERRGSVLGGLASEMMG